MNSSELLGQQCEDMTCVSSSRCPVLRAPSVGRAVGAPAWCKVTLKELHTHTHTRPDFSRTDSYLIQIQCESLRVHPLCLRFVYIFHCNPIPRLHPCLVLKLQANKSELIRSNSSFSPSSSEGACGVTWLCTVKLLHHSDDCGAVGKRLKYLAGRQVARVLFSLLMDNVCLSYTRGAHPTPTDNQHQHKFSRTYEV